MPDRLQQTQTSRFALALALSSLSAAAGAQAIAQVQATDATLDCSGIRAESDRLAPVVEAGDPNSPSVGKTAAGTAANVGGQVAGGVAAQSLGGLFGALGGVVSKVTGVVAQQAAEEKMGPDAEAVQRAGEARDRQLFLKKLAIAKACRADDPAFAGRALSAGDFEQLAATPGRSGERVSHLQPFSLAGIEPTLAAPLAPLSATGATSAFRNELKLGGKRALYISEFRVLFEVGGEVSANTRAGYLPGVNYGATRSKILYKVSQVDVAAYQAITDKAWVDLQSRLTAQGVSLQKASDFVAAYGEVYEASEAASTPAAPVYVEQDLGHTTRKYLVMSPTGMKTHSRGFAGLGAGNMGRRMEWVRGGQEGLMISVAVNIAALETSGSGSSILSRDGASTQAGEAMTITTAPQSPAAQGQADAGAIWLGKPLVVAGSFANFREVGGYDSSKDAVAKSMMLISNLAGVAANQSKRVEMDIDLDGPASSRLMLTGLATFNQGLAEQLAASR